MKNEKLPLRFNKQFYDEPPKPQDGQKKFRIEVMSATSDRVNHWPGFLREDGEFYESEYDEPEETPEFTGRLDHSLFAGGMLWEAKRRV